MGYGGGELKKPPCILIIIITIYILIIIILLWLRKEHTVLIVIIISVIIVIAVITLMMIIDQIRMFCGLVGEPSYIAAAEPYYEVGSWHHLHDLYHEPFLGSRIVCKFRPQNSV